MHGELDVLSFLAETERNVSHHAGSLSHCESVAGSDNNLLGVLKHLGSLGSQDLGVGEGRRVGVLSLASHGTEASEDDIGQRSVHGLAHDSREEGSGRPDERSHHGEQGLVEDESFGAQSPARVRVEEGDHHGHVGSSDGSGHVETESSTGDGAQGQTGGLSGGVSGGAESNQTGEGTGGETDVDHVSAGQHEGVRAQLLGELSVGDAGSGEGDGSHPGTEVGGYIVEGAQVTGVMHQEVSDGSGGGGHTDKRVEGSHGLGEFGGSDLGGQVVTDSTSSTADHGELAVHRGILGGHVHESGGHTGRHTTDADTDAEAGSLLGGETGDASHTSESGPQGEHGCQRGGGHTRGHESSTTNSGHRAGQEVVVVVLSGVVRATEHVEHLLRHNGSSHQVDSGESHGGGS
mmetsp:Transcript_16084/g.35282  ORF Transcript_16084/g.35282 Transcript_16084/m.35282 type:complete len:405 (-) Transcript_16084:929-2143(-)